MDALRVRNLMLDLVLAITIGLGSIAMAWQPDSWVLHNGDYCYDSQSGDWYYFRAGDVQWRVNLGSGAWGVLEDAGNWYFYNWPYAYSSALGNWFWHRPFDEQWCVNLSSGIWSIFGLSSVYDGMELIPAGDFSMGDSFNEGYPEERPVHTVSVSAVYMDMTEVTKQKWDEVYDWAITEGGYSFDSEGEGKGADHPVHSVNWYDAVKWCNARSEMNGLVPAYYTDSKTTSANVYRSGQVEVQNAWVRWDSGYRLPTEAEWEKGARGGLVGRRFPLGDTIDHETANYKANGLLLSYDTSPYDDFTYHPDFDDDPAPYTCPVFSLPPNGYGLYGMSGNVDEWCWDRSGSYSSGHQTDPRGPDLGSVRITRGGTWRVTTFYLRVACRYSVLEKQYGTYETGFRTVLSPEAE